jgi:hypothetical protein
METAAASTPTVERGDGRPKRGYRLANGTKVPGTTTILGRFKESGGLIRWAYKRGLDGLDLYESRDKAAEIGTIVHDAAEEHIHGSDGHALIAERAQTDEDREKCERAFGAFLRLMTNFRMKPVATEVPLISESHLFGGTLDLILEVDGKLCLGDFKTGSAVYDDHVAQLGAYAILWKEIRGESLEGAHLFRFSKESGVMVHEDWPLELLQLGAKQFLALRKAYDMGVEIKRCRR